MLTLIRKIHIYAGLFTFSALVVYGIAGIDGTLAEPPGDTAERAPAVEYREFTPPRAAADKAVADAVHAFLELPLTHPIPAWAIRRNASHDLQLDFYSPNGLARAVVLEKENRLRIEHTRVHFWRYLSHLHAMTLGEHSSQFPLKLWGWYNEAALWSLTGMTLSGLYLWLATRPGWRAAQLTFAAGSAAFLILWIATR